MSNFLSVKEVIRKQNIITRILGFICLVVCFLVYFFAISYRLDKVQSFVLAFGSTLSLFGLCNSFLDPAWRVWAFSNVTDVHELQQVAIERNLISKDGSLLKKFEFRSHANTKKLMDFEMQLNEKPKSVDNKLILPLTEIYYSRSPKVFWRSGLFLAMIVFILTRGYVPGQTLPACIIDILLAIAFAIWDGWNVFKKKPRIILSDEGIETDDEPLHKWEDIWEEKVYPFGIKGPKEWYLFYKFPGGSNNILLNRLDINHDEVAHLLYVYRNRNINN